MKLMKTIRKLCTPAYVYLVISIIAIVAMMIQNGGNHDRFCLGNYECGVESTAAVFLGQGLYSIFWVFVLNYICKAGYKNISWFLVLLPYILMFIILGMFILEGNKEGFKEGKDDDKADGTPDKKHKHFIHHAGKCFSVASAKRYEDLSACNKAHPPKTTQ